MKSDKPFSIHSLLLLLLRLSLAVATFIVLPHKRHRSTFLDRLLHRRAKTTTRIHNRKWLVCGDGDLSYSASIAKELAIERISLVATVLEDEKTHNTVYKNSQQHTSAIEEFDHNVLFAVDATNLSMTFDNATFFDRIQFNFPHWRGKTNTKRNRNLLSQFLQSAAHFVTARGEIRVALCEGQGGSNASTIEEWRQSWTAAHLACQEGLMLKRVLPFEPRYNLSSHRGVDRPFFVGKHPQVYVFGYPNNEPIHNNCQVCFRHELHIMLPRDSEDKSGFPIEDLLDGKAVWNILRDVLPRGVHAEIPIQQYFANDGILLKDPMVVFLIVYCGQEVPLTREDADGIREQLEAAVAAKGLTLRQNRLGRQVSKPFPYPLLRNIVKERQG